MASEQVAPLHFQNTVGPQQSASLHCGKVWFTVEALVDNGENRYSALKSAGGIGLFAAGTVLAIGTAGAGAAVFAGGAAAATITSAGAGISAATTSVFTSVAGAGSSAVSLPSVFVWSCAHRIYSTTPGRSTERIWKQHPLYSRSSHHGW